MGKNDSTLIDSKRHTVATYPLIKERPSNIKEIAPHSELKLEGGLRTKGYYKKSYPDKPLVTVITVVFNGEKYLEETIQNVLSQTYKNIEYIIIDGGSRDGTLNIIKKYAEFIDYWMSVPDKGIYDAMNKGINLAHGDWINFMNAGDWFFDENITEKIFTQDLEYCEIIYGNHETRYDFGFKRIHEVGELTNLWKGMVFSHQAMFVRNTVMKEIKFDLDYELSADFSFIYEAYVENRKFKKLDLIVSSIFANGKSDMNRLKSIIERWKAVKQLTPRFTANLYYFYLIMDALLRIFLKKILPKRTIKLMITNRYKSQHG